MKANTTITCTSLAAAMLMGSALLSGCNRSSERTADTTVPPASAPAAADATDATAGSATAITPPSSAPATTMGNADSEMGSDTTSDLSSTDETAPQGDTTGTAPTTDSSSTDANKPTEATGDTTAEDKGQVGDNPPNPPDQP